eukprot:3223238-Amphidinium_carterae.1
MKDDVTFTVDDIFAEFGPTTKMADEAEKEKARKAIVEKHLLPFLAFADSKTNEAGYLGGDRVCFAELNMSNFLQTLESGMLDYFPKDAHKQYPKLQKMRENVAALPEVAQHRQERGIPAA